MPSGAASLALPVSAAGSPPDPELIRGLTDAHFALGELHLHINALSAETLLDALRAPDRYADLMVRVAGFSGLFVRLSPEVQQDVVSRCHDGD
jgi:formate C-acetyltransferase